MAIKTKAKPLDIDAWIEQHGERQAKAMCRRYFYDESTLEEFAQLFPDYVPDELGEFHSDIYDLYVEPGNDAIAAPRGFSKSTITDTIFLAWVMLTCRYHFIVLISDTFTQATMLLDGLKAELETNEMLLWIYGDVKGREWSNENLIVKGYKPTFDDGEVRERSKVMAKGAGMKIRGSRFLNYRPDLIIIDDLENDEMVESPDRRAKLENWFRKGVMPAMAKDVGKIIYIGTLLHREALLTKIIHGREGYSGWKRLKLQSIKPDGTSLWPERFSVEYLKGMRDDPNHVMYLGPIAFSQEMQNEPIDEADQIFKAEWLHKYTLASELRKFAGENKDIPMDKLLEHWLRRTFKEIIGHIDPAISEKQTADYWAMSTLGVRRSDGHIMQLDLLRMRESDMLVQIDVMLESFRLWGHDRIQVETVAFQAGLYRLALKQGALKGLRPPLQSWKPDRDKRRRAIAASASFAGNLVHLREDLPLHSAFIEELLGFPQVPHDDMVDSFIGAMEPTFLRPQRRVYSKKPQFFK